MSDNLKQKLKSILTFKNIFIILLTIMLIIMGFQQYKSIKNDKKYIFINDSMSYWKNKAGDEYNAKVILIQQINDLKSRNDSISAEYNKIKKQDPIVITKTQTEYLLKDIEIPTVVEKYPSGYKLNWSYIEQQDKNNYIQLNGLTTADSIQKTISTTLNTLKVGSDLILDVVDNENNVKILARTNNKHLTISNIEGAMIDPRKSTVIKKFFPTKHWGLGIHAGIGTGFDINKKSFSVGPNLSVGVSYNILTW